MSETLEEFDNYLLYSVEPRRPKKNVNDDYEHKVAERRVKI